MVDDRGSGQIKLSISAVAMLVLVIITSVVGWLVNDKMATMQQSAASLIHDVSSIKDSQNDLRVTLTEVSATMKSINDRGIDTRVDVKEHEQRLNALERKK